ncbi:MAG: TIGR03016 family PEP-CTERM system-associated outer membrane protein [Candidatus Thiodiazotropha sp.]
MSCSEIDNYARDLRIIAMAGLGLLSLPVSSLAGEWIISPSIGIDHIYTDNVFLSSEDPQSENITRVRPTLSAYKEGARGNFDFNYAPEYRHYWDDTQSNQTINLLRTSGNLEVMENQLFVDAWATSDQTQLSSGRSSPDGITGISDPIDYYTLGVSPYYTTRFGNVSVLEARYSLDRVDYSDDQAVNSTSQSLDMVLGSGTYTVAHAWELAASHTVEDFAGEARDNKISRFRGEYIQQMSRRWALAFAAGYEDYQLVNNNDVDGAIWSAGVIFTPSNHTRFAIGAGERAFGDDYYMDLVHRTAYTVWRMGFTRDYISARDEATEDTLFLRQDDFGELVRDAVLDNPPPVSVTGVSTLSADYYESDRLSGSVSFRSTRTQAVLRANLIKRDYAADSSQQDTRDAVTSIQLNRVLSRKFNGVTRLLWRDHEQELLDYKEWVISLGLTYSLGENAALSTSVGHLERNGDTDLSSYDENRADVGFVWRF